MKVLKTLGWMLNGAVWLFAAVYAWGIAKKIVIINPDKYDN